MGRDSRELVKVALAACIVLGVTALATPAAALVPSPTVIGPIPANAPPGDPSHDYPQLATPLDLRGAISEPSLPAVGGVTYKCIYE